MLKGLPSRCLLEGHFKVVLSWRLNLYCDMTESIQENIEELFSLSADELQLRLDKIESGHHTLFKWEGEEYPDYPRFVEKVIFQPKKCNVEFPPIGPRAFSRGVRSTSSLPDIRSTDVFESISNEDESARSIVVEKKRKRSKKKTIRRFNSPILNVREQRAAVQDDRPLFCEGKGFPKSNNTEIRGPPSKIALEKVRTVNLVPRPDTITTELPRILDVKSANLQQKTQVGPWFRAWSTQKKERCEEQEYDKKPKDVDLHLDVIEQKAVRSFDLDGLLKEARRHQTPKEKNVDEMSLNSAVTYVAKIKQQLDLSSKGGGFMNRTKHISVKDEIQIKKMLRQKLFSFYDFGGSADAFERVVSDVCSKKNPSVMFKNLPSYQTTEQQQHIFPLAAPHTNLPLLPNSPTHLQNLYQLLDTFPWFSWQPRRPAVQSEVVRGSPQIKPRSCYDVEKEIALSDFEDEWESTDNPKLEVRLPSCVA